MSEFRKWLNCVLILAGFLAIIVGVITLATAFPAVFITVFIIVLFVIAVFSLHSLLYGDI